MTILKVRRSPFINDGAASDSSGQTEFDLEQQRTTAPALTESVSTEPRPEHEAAAPATADEVPEKKLVVRSRVRKKTTADSPAAEPEKKPRRQPTTRRSYNRTNDPASVNENPAATDSENKLKLVINDLTRMGMHALRDLAAQYGIPHEDMVAMKKQEIANREILCAIRNINSVTEEVRSGSKEMMKGGAQAADEMRKLNDLTKMITVSMNEMAAGADQIDSAVHEVLEYSHRNKDNISDLADEAGVFRV